MYPSVEARWFMPGAAPEEAIAWLEAWEFAGSKSRSRPQPREDRYIRLPDTNSLGVKLREGRFEVKRRDKELGVVPLAARVAGRLGLWRKWSFKVVEDIGGQLGGGDWITVKKQRYQRKYSLENGQMKAVDPATFPARGCTVEVTRLQVRDADWWSAGLETFGPEEGALRATLELGAARCFDSDRYPTLRVEDSLDYPEWLRRLD